MTVRLEIGRIVKPHGVRGEVVVVPTTNRDTDRFVAGNAFGRSGGGPDLVVEAARPHQGRWLVRFEGVADRNAAEVLRGVLLVAEPLDDPEALWVHELVGRAVVTVAGERVGTVDAVEANPASDLLVLDSGALVPLVFVVEPVAEAPEPVVVDPPVGLLERNPDARRPVADPRQTSTTSGLGAGTPPAAANRCRAALLSQGVTSQVLSCCSRSAMSSRASSNARPTPRRRHFGSTSIS